MPYMIRSYCAGQAFPAHKANDDNEKDNILDKLKTDLEARQLKIKAGQGDVLAEVLCVDIYSYENDNDTNPKITYKNFKC